VQRNDALVEPYVRASFQLHYLGLTDVEKASDQKLGIYPTSVIAEKMGQKHYENQISKHLEK